MIMDANDTTVMFSHKSDEWCTPDWLFYKLNKKYKFTLDPCSTDDNHVVDKYYTKLSDGLSKSWANETVFVNPPYSEAFEWVAKSFDETHNGDCRCVVMLLPARTDSEWFHIFCMDADYVLFVRGRLKFSNSKNSAPFPSIIVVFENGDEFGSIPEIGAINR